MQEFYAVKIMSGFVAASLLKFIST